MADEIDPLDAFMASVSAELEMADRHLSSQKAEIIEADDHMADYVEAEPPLEDTAANPTIDFDDADGEAALNDRDIAVLPIVDHAARSYAPFRRDILKVCFFLRALETFI